jgi:hypothetical protein
VQFTERTGATARANEALLPQGPLPRAAPEGRRGPPNAWAPPCGPTAGPAKRRSRGPPKCAGGTMLPHRSTAGPTKRRSRGAPRAAERAGATVPPPRRADEAPLSNVGEFFPTQQVPRVAICS